MSLAVVNLTDAYTNLDQTGEDLISLVVALSFVSGFIMLFRGIGMYKIFGQNVTQMSRSGELAGPMVYIFVGVALMYFPSTLNTFLYTTFGTDVIEELTYTGTDSSMDWDKIYALINRYSHLVGLIAFFRGLLMISKSGQPGVQPGSITKGIVHLVAGVFLVNIGTTVNVIKYTFGIS